MKYLIKFFLSDFLSEYFLQRITRKISFPYMKLLISENYNLCKSKFYLCKSVLKFKISTRWRTPHDRASCCTREKSL